MLVGTAAAVASKHWHVYPTFDASALLSFGGSIASTSSTMLGFMLAALAVLASINHTHLVKMMRDSGHYRDLLLTMMTGCAFFTACALAGYLLLFGMPACPWLLPIVVGLHVGAAISLFDVGRKMWLVLSNLRG